MNSKTLRVSDVQKLIGGASRAKVQYLVECGFLTPEKGSEGVGDWRAYSPANLAAFMLAEELIKSGLPRRKLKPLFEKMMDRKTYDFWLDPTRPEGPGERKELIVSGDGEDWSLNHYASDYVEIGKPDNFGKVRLPLLKRLNEHKQLRVIVIDLITIKKLVRDYLDD